MAILTVFYFILKIYDNRRLDFNDFFDLLDAGFFVSELERDANHGAVAKGHHDAAAGNNGVGERHGDRVGERRAQRDGESDFAVVLRHGATNSVAAGGRGGSR